MSSRSRGCVGRATLRGPLQTWTIQQFFLDWSARSSFEGDSPLTPVLEPCRPAIGPVSSGAGFPDQSSYSSIRCNDLSLDHEKEFSTLTSSSSAFRRRLRAEVVLMGLPVPHSILNSPSVYSTSFLGSLLLPGLLWDFGCSDVVPANAASNEDALSLIVSTDHTCYSNEYTYSKLLDEL